MASNNFDVRRFVFKQPYKTIDGEYKKGFEVTIMRRGDGFVVYSDMGMLPYEYANEILSIINDKKKCETYLRELELVNNRIF